MTALGSEDAESNNPYPLPNAVECPWCGGTDTRLEAPFGGQLSVSQYYCRDCRTVFDWMKWEEKGPDQQYP